MEGALAIDTVEGAVRYLNDDNLRLLQQVIQESGLSMVTGMNGGDLVKRAIEEFNELSRSGKVNIAVLSLAQINKKILSIAKRMSISDDSERKPTLTDKEEEHRVDLNNHLFPKITHEPVFKDEIDDAPIPKDEIEKLIQMESEKRRLDIHSNEPSDVSVSSDEPSLAPTTLESRVKTIEDTLLEILNRISKLEGLNDN